MRMWRNWDPHTLLVVIQNGTGSVENSVVSPWTITHTVTTGVTISTFWETARCIPNRIENTRSHKNVYINVYSSMIHDNKKSETIRMSLNRAVDKQNVVYPYNIFQPFFKKDQRAAMCYNLDQPWQYYASHKRRHLVWLHLCEMSRIG